MIEAILLLGIGDRVRGSGWFRFNHFIGMLLMNLAILYLLQPHGWWIAYVLLAPCLGYAPGLNPMLSDAWVGKFNMDLIPRGFLWGLPFYLIHPLYTLPFAAAFIVTPFIFGAAERKFGAFRKYGMDWWGVMELTRGLLVGVGLALLAPQ